MENSINTWIEIVIGIISAYLLYYVHKKGQNQADKEDLKKLTEIVEDVKMKNNIEIESIRANLSLLTDRGKQIFSEEKDSIIVFFAQLNTWIWESLNNNIDDYTISNFDDIPNKLIHMQDDYNKTKVTFSKVVLIINNSELVSKGKEAINTTYQLHIYRTAYLKELYKIINQIKESKTELAKTYGNEEDAENYIAQYGIIYNKSISAKVEIMKEYNVKNIVLFDTAIISVAIFKESAQNYLRKEISAN